MDKSVSSAMQQEGGSHSLLMPLPDHDFDPTEAAIPWKVLSSRGWRVAFSTEHGNIAEGDLHRLRGPLPGLISASVKAQAAYEEMTHHPAYLQPVPYAEIDPGKYLGIVLPGGDALRMHYYLEDKVLQAKVLQFWQQDKVVGAICHGMLVLARTIDPQTGRSILYGRKVTAVPRWLDRVAYKMDAWFVKRGYIMYPQCVEEEVRASLAHPDDLIPGPGLRAPFAVTDGNLVTARWYMDAELFAERFAEALVQHQEVSAD